MRRHQTTWQRRLSVGAALAIGVSTAGCAGWKPVLRPDGSSAIAPGQAPRSGPPRPGWYPLRYEGPRDRAWVRGFAGATSDFEGPPPRAAETRYVVVSGPPDATLGPVTGPPSAPATAPVARAPSPRLMPARSEDTDGERPPRRAPLPSFVEGEERPSSSSPSPSSRHEEDLPEPPSDDELPPLSIAGRWDLEMALMALHSPDEPAFAASLSARVIHHFDFGLVMGLEVAPLFVGASRRQWMYGAGSSVWFGPEGDDFAVMFGLGVASHNGVLSGNQGSFPAVVGTAGIDLRFGPVDGVHGELRVGVAGDGQLVTLGYLRGVLNLQFIPEVVPRVHLEYHVAGATQMGVGVRSWLVGRGDVGSVGLDLMALVAWREFVPPTRARGFGPAVTVLGPTVEVGLAMRF